MQIFFLVNMQWLGGRKSLKIVKVSIEVLRRVFSMNLLI